MAEKNKVTAAEVPRVSVHMLTDLGQKTFMGEDACLAAKDLPGFKKQGSSGSGRQTGAKEEGQGALASASILFSISEGKRLSRNYKQEAVYCPCINLLPSFIFK